MITQKLHHPTQSKFHVTKEFFQRDYSYAKRNQYNHKADLATLFILCLLISSQVYAQELEPRSLTNLPIGTNFGMLSYGYASGNILFDQALPLEDVNAKSNSIVAAYVHSFNFLGMGGKYNVILPYATGNWEGLYRGIDTTTSRSGMADIRIGISINFIGSPAIEKTQFGSYQQKTIVGFSLQMDAPTGQYFEDRLINLGSNRWAFRPQLGVSHRIKTWYIEYAVNTWLYTTNPSFLGAIKIDQKPLGTIKLHLIKSFEKGIWAALGAGYAFGGRIYKDNVSSETNISTARIGAILSIPVHPKHSFKITLITAKRFEQGADFDALNLTYQYVWNK